MRFLVDNQLPIALAAYLRSRGHDCVHVLELNLDEADDRFLWDFCAREKRIVITNDQDFIFLANRAGDTGRLVWVRVGNCRNDALIQSISGVHDTIVSALDSGQRIVEVH